MAKKNSALMKPVALSSELEAVIGKGPMPRTAVTKKIWEYIKKHDLQDAENRRNIVPDEKLAKVFGSKKAMNMFEMTRVVSGHLT
jgi:chromatin remodeling complex protein RSC6